MGLKKIDPVQSFLMGQFDKKGLKTLVPFSLFPKSGGCYTRAIIVKGFEKNRYNDDKILIEALFMINGTVSADCHWIAEGEEPQMKIPPGCIEVDFIEIGNLVKGQLFK